MLKKEDYQKYSALPLPDYDEDGGSSVRFFFEHAEGKSHIWTDNGILRIEKEGFGGDRFRIDSDHTDKWLKALMVGKQKTLPTTLGKAKIKFLSDGSLEIDSKNPTLNCYLLIKPDHVEQFIRQLALCNIWGQAFDNCIMRHHR